MRKKIEKKFWDMEIIGNRRKSKFTSNTVGQKKSLKIKKYFSIRAEKLHSIKAKNKLKHFGQYFFLKKVCNTQRAPFNHLW